MAQAALTGQDVFDKVKRRMSEQSSDTGNLDSDLCIDVINEFSRILESEVDMPSLVRSDPITLISGQTEYALPTDFSRVINVGSSNLAGSTTPVEFEDESLSRFRRLVSGHAYYLNEATDEIWLYMNGAPDSGSVLLDYFGVMDDIVLLSETLPGHKRYHYMYLNYAFKVFAQVDGEFEDFQIQDIITDRTLLNRKTDEPRTSIRPRRAFTHKRRRNGY